MCISWIYSVFGSIIVSAVLGFILGKSSYISPIHTCFRQLIVVVIPVGIVLGISTASQYLQDV